MVVKFLGKKIVHPKENPGYAYEKRVPDLRWYGAPRMVNPALNAILRHVSDTITACL